MVRRTAVLAAAALAAAILHAAPAQAQLPIPVRCPSQTGEFLELPLDDQRAEYHVQTIFMQSAQIEGDSLPLVNSLSGPTSTTLDRTASMVRLEV